MSQHKVSKRKSLRKALRNKGLADLILGNIVDIQTNHNTIMSKLDGDTAAALDIDYATSWASSSFEYDRCANEGPNKANLRVMLQKALCHKKLANEIVDSIEELKAVYDALIAKLNAEAGTLAGVDYESTLGVDVIGIDTIGSDAQHKASFRRSLVSALAHKSLANAILDAIEELQTNIDTVLIQLDTTPVTMSTSGMNVSVMSID